MYILTNTYSSYHYRANLRDDKDDDIVTKPNELYAILKEEENRKRQVEHVYELVRQSLPRTKKKTHKAPIGIQTSHDAQSIKIPLPSASKAASNSASAPQLVPPKFASTTAASHKPRHGSMYMTKAKSIDTSHNRTSSLKITSKALCHSTDSQEPTTVPSHNPSPAIQAPKNSSSQRAPKKRSRYDNLSLSLQNPSPNPSLSHQAMKKTSRDPSSSIQTSKKKTQPIPTKAPLPSHHHQLSTTALKTETPTTQTSPHEPRSYQQTKMVMSTKRVSGVIKKIEAQQRCDF